MFDLTLRLADYLGLFSPSDRLRRLATRTISAVQGPSVEGPFVVRFAPLHKTWETELRWE